MCGKLGIALSQFSNGGYLILEINSPVIVFKAVSGHLGKNRPGILYNNTTQNEGINYKYKCYFSK